MSLFYLMHETNPVLLISMNVGFNYFRITGIKEYCNKLKLPLPLKSNARISKYYQLEKWWLSRFINVSRNEYIIVSDQFCHTWLSRMYYHQYNIALLTYGASLSDKYWLNPVEPATIDNDEYREPFVLNPTTWDVVNNMRQNFSKDVGEVFYNSVMDKEKIKHELLDLNLTTMDISLTGDRTKRWIKKEDELYVQKIFSNTEAGIDECKRQVAESEFIKSMNPMFSAHYTQDEQYKNICYSKRFLNENEEYIDAYQVLLYDLYSVKDTKKSLIKYATKLGCDKKLLKEYFELIDKIKEHFNYEREFNFDNVGFIIDGKTNKIIRPAPICGRF